MADGLTGEKPRSTSLGSIPAPRSRDTFPGAMVTYRHHPPGGPPVGALARGSGRSDIAVVAPVVDRTGPRSVGHPLRVQGCVPAVVRPRERIPIRWSHVSYRDLIVENPFENMPDVSDPFPECPGGLPARRRGLRVEPSAPDPGCGRFRTSGVQNTVTTGGWGMSRVRGGSVKTTRGCRNSAVDGYRGPV